MACIDEIVRLTNRAPVTFNRLCLKLAINERELLRLVKKGQADGYGLLVRDGHVVTRIAPRAEGGTYVHRDDAPAGRKVLAHITDLHAGSLHFQKDALIECAHRAWDRGARVVLGTGDNLDGAKDVLTMDQERSSLDGQAEILRDVLKKCPPLRWLTVSGNHDGYFDSKAGFSSGKYLEGFLGEAGIKWHHLGQCRGRARIYGAHVNLWHPHGGTSSRNALRRIMNAEAEKLEERCDLLVLGHFHKTVPLQVYPEPTYCLSGGTFQAKRSEFANRIGGGWNGWDVGCGLVHFTRRADGTVGEFSSEFLAARGVSS